MFSTSNIKRCLFKIFTPRNQTGPTFQVSTLSLSPELFLFSRKASVRILARSGSLSLPGIGRRQERQGKREKEPKPKSPSPSPTRAQEHNSTSLALDYSKTKSCACHTLQNLILRNYECLAHILFPIPMILF